jgi:hypothetical protein
VPADLHRSCGKVNREGRTFGLISPSDGKARDALQGRDGDNGQRQARFVLTRASSWRQRRKARRGSARLVLALALSCHPVNPPFSSLPCLSSLVRRSTSGTRNLVKGREVTRDAALLASNARRWQALLFTSGTHLALSLQGLAGAGSLPGTSTPTIIND